MATVSAAFVTLSLASAASQHSATPHKLAAARFNGLKACPLLRQEAAVTRPVAVRRMCVRAAANPQTLSAVQGIIAQQLATDVDKIVPEAKFADLGADSLDTVEIIMALEETFMITLDEGGAQKITTVQEAADMIQSSLSEA